MGNFISNDTGISEKDKVASAFNYINKAYSHKSRDVRIFDWIFGAIWGLFVIQPYSAFGKKSASK